MSGRRYTGRGVLACALLGGALLFCVALDRPSAAEEKSAAQILDALRPQRSRSMSGSAAEQNTQDLHFIDTIRSKSRSLSEPEREEVATAADAKPNLDLEIKFDYNSDVLNSRAIPAVTSLGQALSDPDLKGGVFLIGGHTDAKGGEKYNVKLSERRAEAVKRYLVAKFGLSDENLVPVGFGKAKLKNAGDPFGAENRRVQIVNWANR